MLSSKRSLLSQSIQLICMKPSRFFVSLGSKNERNLMGPTSLPSTCSIKAMTTKITRDTASLSCRHLFTTEGDLWSPGGTQYICLPLLWAQAQLWSWNILPGKDRIIHGYIIAGAPYSYITRAYEIKLIYRSMSVWSSASEYTLGVDLQAVVPTG